MPAGDGIGLDDDEHIVPAAPDPAQRHPEEAIIGPQARPRVCSLVDRQLLAKRQDLKDMVPAGEQMQREEEQREREAEGTVLTVGTAASGDLPAGISPLFAFVLGIGGAGPLDPLAEYRLQPGAGVSVTDGDVFVVARAGVHDGRRIAQAIAFGTGQGGEVVEFRPKSCFRPGIRSCIVTR